MSSKFAVTLLLGLSATLFLPLVQGARVPIMRVGNKPSGLQKRVDNARFTFFDPGLGACGQTHSNADFIVALNAPQWDGGKHCFEMISIQYGGKTHSAQIVDLCPGCEFGALDMSRDLFSFFDSQDKGVIHGSWDFGSGGGGGGGNAPPPQTTQEPPKTTTQPPPPPPETTQAPPPPTTTRAPPPPTTTQAPPPSTTSKTSTSSSSTTTSSTTSSTSTSASASSSSATPTSLTGTGLPDGTINEYMVGIGNMASLIAAAAGLQGQ
ncbi:hypothetical protein AAF712_001413 [Marasmius tenuissimus]|uniref:Uncharacterized protein n=1 Tax=Marasmius tenuissimus TaxID=585030 RepID=A0ABR3AC69_9AGAR